MRQILYLAIICISFCCGCSKDNNSTTNPTTSSKGYIRFKLDGVQKEYSVLFSSMTLNGNYAAVARKDSIDPLQGISIALGNFDVNKTNTLANHEDSFVSVNVLGGIQNNLYGNQDFPKTAFQFKVTKSKTSTNGVVFISGTFSGEVGNGLISKNSIITDGIVYNPLAD